MCSSLEVDRISYLPPEELNAILSFLDMKEVVQTSLLSKKWRYTWLSVSSLSFDHSLWQGYYKCYHKLVGFPPAVVFSKPVFMNFVDRVLFLHTGSNINSFSLFGSYCLCNGQLDKWLTKVVRSQLEEIYLELDSLTTIPRFMFTSSVQLKTLSLVSAQLPQGNSVGETELNCPVLETLIFLNCHHHGLNVLRICDVQLKNLGIENNSRCCVGLCMLKLLAPSLRLIELQGFMYSNYLVEDVSSLDTLRFGYVLHERIDGSLLEVFKSFQNVTTLEIQDCWLKENFYSSSLANGRRPTFINQLQELEIQNLEGSESELKLLEWLLEAAVVLENVAITTTRARSSSQRKKLAKFGKKLHSLPTASSTAKIHFLIRTWI